MRFGASRLLQRGKPGTLDAIHLNRLAILACALALSHPAMAAEPAPRACEAETKALMTLKCSWPQLYDAAIALPSRCFDGYFAEGISDTIVRKMGQDWAGFIATLSAHSADERFMSLVLRSINGTLDPKDIKAAAHHATTECPEKLKKQCASILKEAAEALRQ